MREARIFSRRSFIQAFSLPVFVQGGAVGSFIMTDLEKLTARLKGKEPMTWVFAGDSITQGAHHTYGARCYPEIIAERVRWELRRISDVVINSGANGTNTKYLLDNFEWYVSRFSPSVVSFMYGINDCQEKAITARLFGEYLRDIIRLVRRQNAIPIIHTPNQIDMKGMLSMKTASRAKLPEYVDVITEIAQEHKCILVNHWTDWKNKNVGTILNWLDDPMHPNAEGHAQMARLFFKSVSIFDPDAFTCAGKK